MAESGDQMPPAHKVVKVATAATAGGSLLVLSGLTMVGAVIGLTVATPLLVIFSPVLVPTAMTICLLMLGFISSGGFGAAAVAVIAWMFRYLKARSSSAAAGGQKHNTGPGGF